MGTAGTVLTWLALLVALVLGALIILGVIPLDRYIEEHQDKRARKRRSREPLGSPTRNPRPPSSGAPGC
jgi:hypothetical protein